MRKMLAGKIILFVVVLIGVNGELLAQDDAPLIPVLFAQQDDHIAFYGLDDQNTLIEMGHLPENFDLTPYWNSNRSGSDTETRWLFNWWNMNVVLSPDGSQIALTADSPVPDQDAIHFYLFLYDVQSGDLQQAYSTIWSGGPRTDLRWSPDSRAILIEPSYSESPYAEPFIYLVGSGHVTPLHDTPTERIWENDSNALLEVRSYDPPVLTLIDPYRNIRHTIAEVEGLSPESVEWIPPLCEFVWSPEVQRWYFIAQCGTEITPAERVYSVTLDGTVTLEADFPAYLAQRLGLPQDESYIGRIDLRNLYVHNGSIYVTLDFYDEFYSSNGAITRNLGWRVFKIGNSQTAEQVFAYDSEPFSDFARSVPSPDLTHMAFITDGLEDNEVVIGNLKTNSIVGHLARAEWDTSGAYWRYSMGRWIDNQRFLYEDMNDVWLFDVSDQTFTNLTEDMEQQAWLLPQTNSN